MITKRVISYALASVLLLSANPALAGKPVPIYDCGTIITEPGKYHLINDLANCSDFGVWILGDDITFDLKGHSISCLPEDRLQGGIIVGTEQGTIIRNVTVRNGHVANCNDGIALLYAENCKITRMSSTGNRAVMDEYGTGITVAWSSHNKITHNQTYGNETSGIATFYGDHNLFKHNLSTENSNGIWSVDEHYSQFLCNQAHANFGALGIGPGSSNNVVRGNFATGNGTGIGAVGFAWAGFYWQAIAADNVFKKNLSKGNYSQDVVEAYFDLATGEVLLEPNNRCLNTWRKNEFGISVGPEVCIGYSKELDDDDVCAFDDEDSDHDSDSDSD